MAKGFLLALLLCLVICGCSDSENHPVTLTSITVTPSTTSIAPGTTVQFKALGTYSNGSSADLTTSAVWSSSNTAVATVSATGLATGGSIGSTTITATSGQVSGSATLTTASVQSITVTPGTPVAVAGSGQTIQFKAMVTLANGATQDQTNFVTWSSSNIGAATITPAGLATVGGPGSATITATSGTVSGSATLTAATLVSIALTPSNPALALGSTQQFVAMGTLSNGSSTDVSQLVTWSSANSSIVGISASGLASALAVGSTSVSAGFQGLTQTTLVTVAGPTTVAVSPTSATVITGGTQQFTATGIFADGSQRDLTTLVTWSASSTPAGVATVSNAAGTQGLATGTANGSALITATLAGASGSAQLVVKTLSSLIIAPVNPAVRVGSSVQLAATGSFLDGSSAEVTNQLAWSSSSPGVATVSNSAPTKGLVTGETVGSTVIKASFGGMSSSITVTVVQSIVTPNSEVFVANFGNGFLSLIDTGSNALITPSIRIGGAPKSVAVNPGSNLAYLTDNSAGTLSVVDLTSNLPAATVSTGAGAWGVAVNVVANRVYVANNQANTVSVIEVTPNLSTTNTVIATIPVTAPRGLAVNPATNRLYVTNFTANTLSVIDTTQNTVLASVNIGNGPTDVTLDPATNLVYVANVFSTTLTVLNASSDLNQVISNIPVGTNAQRVALDSAAKILYVTVGGNSNALVVIDTNKNSQLASIPLGTGAAPDGVAVKPSANRIFVANNGSNTVSVINSLSNAVVATVTGFVQPSGIATYP